MISVSHTSSVLTEDKPISSMPATEIHARPPRPRSFDALRHGIQHGTGGHLQLFPSGSSGVSIVMDVPFKNGWFLLGKIHLKWMMSGGTPILGNLQACLPEFPGLGLSPSQNHHESWAFHGLCTTVPSDPCQRSTEKCASDAPSKPQPRQDDLINYEWNKTVQPCSTPTPKVY